jgi:glycogen operon protein
VRERRKRSLLATLLLSQGVPMIVHGDELGRTQQGNNNVYCQDNELSWIDWDEARIYDSLTHFTATLCRLRSEHPIFRRRRFFDGRPVGDSGIGDIAWLRADGAPMTEEDWVSAGTIAVFLNGHGIPEPDALGEPIVDDSFLLLFNPLPEGVTFTVPGAAYGDLWEVVIDSADPLLATPERQRGTVKPGARVEADAHTVIVLRCSV